jgi:DNA-binding MarR family transcriptional regulator
MSTNDDELLEVAKEIRDILSRIYVCFEDQYLEIQRKKAGEKLKALEAILTTPARRKIYSLLFDPRNLSQTEIAKEVQVSQPTVSLFVKELLGQDLIEQVKGENGSVYRDKYDLTKLV